MYDLLAIDLDGTLLGPDGAVSAEDAAAVCRARRAGMLVTLCTGRGLVEMVHAARAVDQADPVVVAGGSLVSCPVSARTLHRFAMELALVREVVSSMVTHGHAALVLKDAHAAGYDYLVVSERGADGLDPVTRWWFEHLGVPVRYAASLEDDEHPEFTVRLGVCGTRGSTRRAAVEVRENFAGRATVHHFAAVSPGDAPADPDDVVCILEVFDKEAHKWSAVSHLARERGIAPGRIAAIGNDVNDVILLENAGLGVAMGNAIPEAKAAADRVTLDNTRCGVARAIDHILDGSW